MKNLWMACCQSPKKQGWGRYGWHAARQKCSCCLLIIAHYQGLAGSPCS